VITIVGKKKEFIIRRPHHPQELNKTLQAS
jgi:hypothetical protein